MDKSSNRGGAGEPGSASGRSAAWLRGEASHAGRGGTAARRTPSTWARLALLVGLAATIAVVAVQASAAAGAITVRGDQLLAGAQSCEDADAGTYLMKGDLVGCWYTDTFVVVAENPGGGYRASGTEHFVGCLDTNGNGACDPAERYGRFETSFTFTAKYAPSGDEIHGRCHHPIVRGSGSGDFVGVSGVLSFKDIPSEGRFPYHGNLQL